MKLVDANVLLYAVDEGAEHHELSHRWLDAQMSGRETILLPWVSLLAFVRVATHPAIYERPLSMADAWGVVDHWTTRPVVITPEPDASHVRRMVALLSATGIGGNLVNDAHLAALALQHRATVVSFDNDFDRFDDVVWERPALP